MAKRFTDSEKWKDAWFMDLPSKYKLFWLYLLDECNHAGIWKVNFKISSFYIGEHLEYSEVKRLLNARITILSDEYWFINKFIKYQYKCDIEGLNPKNKAHLSTIKILNEWDNFKHLTTPLLGVKDKDKDKELVISKEVVEKKVDKPKKFIPPTEQEFRKEAYEKIVQSYGKDKFNQKVKGNVIAKYHAWNNNDWKDGYNKPIKNWKAKVNHSLKHFLE